MNQAKSQVNPTVREQIQKNNPWYVGSQFEWANKPAIRPIYDKRKLYFVHCMERAKKRLGANLRVLDAGCGDGYWLSRLSTFQGLELTGVDYNPLRVERARQAVPSSPSSVRRVRVLVGDLTSIKAEERFDVILLNQVIEHVEDDVGLLRTVRGLLREGGVLILGTPNEGSWLQQRQIRKQGASFQTDHVHFYTEDEIRRKILAAGFCIDSVMREVFYIGNSRLYYWLTARRWGFKFLELMTWLWPSGCSDYYFECRVVGERGSHGG